MVTEDRLRKLLRYDPCAGHFMRLTNRGTQRIGDIAGSINTSGHIQIKIDGRSYLAHRLAWLYMTGAWPLNEIDHIDANKENNRLENLREATKIQNGMNRRAYSNNQSGYKGVHWYKKNRKFGSHIRVNKKLMFLGLFDTAEEAHAAYVEAARKHFGAFARAA